MKITEQLFSLQKSYLHALKVLSENCALAVSCTMVLPYLLLSTSFVMTSDLIYFYGFASYSAISLSFAGGVHWGMAVIQTKTGSHNFERMILASLVPVVTGWVAFYHCILHGCVTFSVFLLLLSFTCFLLYEHRYSMARWPDWYLIMRRRMTSVIVVTHVVLLLRAPSLFILYS